MMVMQSDTLPEAVYMDIYPFLKGIIIGFSIAAPIGPIGIICIRRTLTHNRISGLVSGLGVATADGLYSAIVAFGLTAISNILVGQQFWFRLIGGLFLLILGLRIFFSRPAEKDRPDSKNNYWGDYASTFFLTATHPVTIIAFTAVFAGLGLGNTEGDYWPAVLAVIGVFLGSTLWWIILSSGVNLFRSRITPRLLISINRAAGLIMIAFAVYAFVSLWYI
jgi:threonine/homoserine/homoserine lactone efflux protein